MKYLVKIPDTVLLAMIILPFLLWVGFVNILGAKAFELTRNDSVQSADVTIKTEQITDATTEKITRQNRFKRDKSNPRKELESLNRALTFLEDKKEEPKEEPKVKTEPEVVKEVVYIEKQPVRKKSRTTVADKPKEVEPVKEESTDPYESFVWISDNSSSGTEEVKNSFVERDVPGQIAENKRITVGESQRIYIRNREPFNLKNGVEVPKNTMMDAQFKFSNNKMSMTISSVKVGGNVYSCLIEVGDERGNTSIVTKDVDETISDAEKQLDDITKSMGRSATVSLPMNLGSLSIPTRQRDNKTEILFNTDLKVTLKVKQ